ncbi:MAG: DUF3300 domain-containing protein [Opitutae bacterium]|nr:DUF3300 domain-containing protein [Opitutae bacterium]
MKHLRSAFLVILGLLACGRTMAADPEPREALTPKQIEELVSPIALYPDPLVALILPAATRPSDIVLAARFLQGGGNPEQAATEPWDDSVRALVRYREVIAYLDQNLAWTRSLGECFLNQPDAVMDAIQMVRVRARAAGLLKGTGEQEVIVESDEIRIVPASPTVIYVPRYDPEILYVSSYPYYYPGPFLTFGIGYGVGAWLSYDCDWHYRTVRIAHRPAHWYHRPDWRGHHPDRPSGATAWTRWAPPPRHDRRFDRPTHHSGVVLHPDRPRGISDSSPHVAPPSTRSRDAGRPGTGQSSFRSESPRRVEVGNQPRYDRTNPRHNPSVTINAPVAGPAPAVPAVVHRPPSVSHRPPTQISPPRVYNEASAGPRREHTNPSSVHPVRTYTSPAPRVTAPPPERSRPTVDARPAEPRGESRDRSDHRQRAESNGPHRQLN